MAFGASKRQAGGGGGSGLMPDLDVNDWHEPERQPRDVKKLALVAGLGILSWVATYVGMLELIEANMGDLPLVHKAIIGFSVAMLMTMVIWLLDQLFAPIGAFTKIIYAAGYIFLTVISVGFGFGFYWKVLESRSEASRSAEGAVGQVQTALFAASTRLEQLQQTLDGLTTMSAGKAATERATGTSCPNSKPGDGPRRKLRDDDAARFSFASEFVKGRVTAVKGEMGALNADLAKIVGEDKSIVDAKTGTRNEFMKSLSRKLDLTVTGFNAFRTDPQLKQIRTDLNERAEKATFPDTKGASFSCPDPQLSTALKGVVRAIDELPVLEKPKIAAVEGSEATIEAFRRLTATFYGLLSFKMPPSADELRELQKKAVQSVETPAGQQAAQKITNIDGVGLSKRDYVPLAIAVFVDLCLLLVSMGRPINRLGGLVHKMRAAERGPVIQILSRFNDIHRDPEIRRNFEVFRHVVFDFHGDYYVAVPLDAPFGVARQQAANGGRPVYVSQSLTDVGDHQVEAHILANLFTSFEKERIFARVYSPFLTTRTIQKRLARQGSKFAHAKAFRVYRFRDGAWSEIILGAVMGAARRVEAEKRARNLAEGHRLPNGSTTAQAQPQPQQPQTQQQPQAGPQHGQPQVGPRPAPAYNPQGVPPSAPYGHAPASAQPPYARNGSPGPAPAGAFHDIPRGPMSAAMSATVAPGARPAYPAYPAPRAMAPGITQPTASTVPPHAYAEPSPTTVPPSRDLSGRATHASVEIVRPSYPLQSEAAPLPPEHVNKYGPYAAHVEPPLPVYRPQPEPADRTARVQPAAPGVPVGHANNNTAPAAPRFEAAPAPAAVAAEPANVIAMPGVRPVETLIPDVSAATVVVAPPAMAPRAEVAAAAPVTQVTATRGQEDMVTYELKRETLTATVPVSQVPDNLLAGLRRAGAVIGSAPSAAPAAEAPVLRQAAAPVLPVAELAAIAPPRPAAFEQPGEGVAQDAEIVVEPELSDDEIDEDVIILGPSAEEWTAADRAMTSRLAKRQA